MNIKQIRKIVSDGKWYKIVLRTGEMIVSDMGWVPEWKMLQVGLTGIIDAITIEPADILSIKPTRKPTP